MPHDHIIVDDDRRFIVDIETRTITNASGNKPLLMQKDHKSERFTFEMPRSVEGHNVEECDSVEIHYQNTGKGTSVSTRPVSIDKYRVKDLTIDTTDENLVTFTWLLERSATLHAGTLDFQIKFICYEDEANEIEDFVWQTDKYIGIEIRAGLDANQAISDNFPDAIEDLDSRVENLEKGTSGYPDAFKGLDDRVESIEKVTGDYSGNLEKLDNRVGTIEKVTGTYSGSLTKLDSRVATVEDTTDEQSDTLESLDARVDSLEKGLVNISLAFADDGSGNVALKLAETDTDYSFVFIDDGAGNVAPKLAKKDSGVVAYLVTNRLTNVTTTGMAVEVTEGGSYTAVLTAAEGYILDTVQVTMGELDVTDAVYNSATGTITISSVTGDIVIVATAIVDESIQPEVDPYTVTYSLQNAEINSQVISGDIGAPYSVTLISTHSSKAFWYICVTMDETDITETCVSTDTTSGTATIYIAEVTGDITITAYGGIMRSVVCNLVNARCNTQGYLDGVEGNLRIYADSGYIVDPTSVTMTMGGVDVTSDVTIAQSGNDVVIGPFTVTGDITITALTNPIS